MAMVQTDPHTSASPAGSDDRVQHVIRHLRVLFRSLQAHSRRISTDCGVSAAQLWALWEMHLEPGLNVSDLSQRLSIHASTASNMLDKLERKGLMERRRADKDQRVVSLYLTESGQTLLDNAPAPAQGALNRALRAMPAAELARLEAGLGILLDTMEARDDQAALRPIADD
ncbi:MarR family winged helix-turn-helix transcriptional regulator [Ectothiorhodospira lacustris]|uniref:MarR family winged helix-turn-helix transcriptional regulator n=1 Tax=Ectothiorhodospira lacustris TaxID=2899127 RepID=UPI003D30F4E8